MKKEKRPIDIINEIVKRNPESTEINFDVYYYVLGALTHKSRLIAYSLKTKPLANLSERIRSVKVPRGWGIGLASKIKLKNNAHKHIPQIDFKCRLSTKNLAILKKQLRKIMKISSGYILQTGNSYHYIGWHLLADAEWRYFLGSCLLFRSEEDKYMVDARWIGHALRRGYSVLRIFSMNEKPEPRIVARLTK